MDYSILRVYRVNLMDDFILRVYRVNLMAEAQLGGGAAGRAPSPSTWEGALAPPLQNEKKERMAKISITGIRKPIELL